MDRRACNPALVFFYLLLSTKWSLGITVACVSGGCCGFDWVENCCCCWGCDCDEDSAQSSSPFEFKQTFEFVQSAMHSTFLNRRIIHHIKSLKDEVQIKLTISIIPFIFLARFFCLYESRFSFTMSATRYFIGRMSYNL